jgi:hypothetical protein
VLLGHFGSNEFRRALSAAGSSFYGLFVDNANGIVDRRGCRGSRATRTSSSGAAL